MTAANPGRPESAAIVYGVDVDAVAAAVQACPGVSDLHGGRYGEVTTYLPGRAVRGVVIDGGMSVVIFILVCAFAGTLADMTSKVAPSSNASRQFMIKPPCVVPPTNMERNTGLCREEPCAAIDGARCVGVARSPTAYIRPMCDYSEHEYFLAVETAFAHWEAIQNAGR